MVFDLDPGPGVDVLGWGEVAFWVKDWLEARGLDSFIKTSGSKDLQLYVPLNTTVTFDRTKVFAPPGGRRSDNETSRSEWWRQ